MLNKTRLTFILGVILCGAATATFADTIYLTSGQVIEGTVVERTDDEIKVDTGIGVLVTYYLDEVKEIFSATRTQNFQDISQPTEGHEGAGTTQTHPRDAAETSPAVPTFPTHSQEDLEAGSREEHFLLQKYKKEIEEKTQTPDTQALPSKPMDTDEYLEKQLRGKQALLKEEIVKKTHLTGQKLTQGVNALFKGKSELAETLKTKSLPPYFPSLLIGIMIGFYVLVCYPCMMIAQKLGLAGWMAWVPIIQIFLLFKMAGRPWWWVLLLLIPVINLLIPIILWMDIAKRFNKSVLLGILMIVPVLNLMIPWHIAFSVVAEE